MSLSVTKRNVRDADREILLTIYESSREIELSATDWGSELRRRFCEMQLDAQSRHYKEVYPEATHEILLVEDLAAGRLYLDKSLSQIAILDLTILPGFRRRGIATNILKELVAEAERTERSVRVYLEAFNPAQRLFLSLGFRQVPDEQINIRYEWRRHWDATPAA